MIETQTKNPQRLKEKMLVNRSRRRLNMIRLEVKELNHESNCTKGLDAILF